MTMHGSEGEYRFHLDLQGFEMTGTNGARIVAGRGRMVVTRQLDDTPPTAD